MVAAAGWLLATRCAFRFDRCANGSGDMRASSIDARIDSFTSDFRLPMIEALENCKEAHRMNIAPTELRRQFRGKVKEIIEGPVVSEVDVETPSGMVLTSFIATRSVRELELAVGRDVIALVRRSEVAIATV